jgi:hypothetical protein
MLTLLCGGLLLLQPVLVFHPNETLWQQRQGYGATLWDNQMIRAVDNSLHLFYLAGWGSGHDGWGHAVAEDGVHFVDHGQIFRGSGGAGNPPGWTGYGMVNVAPAGSPHKYIINFSRCEQHSRSHSPLPLSQLQAPESRQNA